MTETDHKTIIFFIVIMWLIIIFVCLLNTYYYSKIYNEGGTEYVSTGESYTYAVLSVFLIALSVICGILTFYLYYEETKRLTHIDDIETGILISSSEINAMNNTYKNTSDKLSKDIQLQMDDQIRGVSRVVTSKNRELNEKDKELYNTKSKLYNLSQRQNMLEDEIDRLTSQLDEAQTNYLNKNEQSNEKNDNDTNYIPQIANNNKKQKPKTESSDDESVDSKDSKVQKEIKPKKDESIKKRKSLLEQI